MLGLFLLDAIGDGRDDAVFVNAQPRATGRGIKAGDESARSFTKARRFTAAPVILFAISAEDDGCVLNDTKKQRQQTHNAALQWSILSRYCTVRGAALPLRFSHRTPSAISSNDVSRSCRPPNSAGASSASPTSPIAYCPLFASRLTPIYAPSPADRRRRPRPPPRPRTSRSPTPAMRHCWTTPISTRFTSRCPTRCTPNG